MQINITQTYQLTLQTGSIKATNKPLMVRHVFKQRALCNIKASLHFFQRDHLLIKILYFCAGFYSDKGCNVIQGVNGFVETELAFFIRKKWRPQSHFYMLLRLAPSTREKHNSQTSKLLPRKLAYSLTQNKNRHLQHQLIL